MNYEYKAEVVRVIDGDTVEMDIDLGFGVKKRETLRLLGINAPEVRGESRKQGLAAEVYLEQLLIDFAPLTIRTVKKRTTNASKKGKYGRYLATIYGRSVEGIQDLNLTMIQDGHAVEASY